MADVVLRFTGHDDEKWRYADYPFGCARNGSYSMPFIRCRSTGSRSRRELDLQSWQCGSCSAEK